MQSYQQFAVLFRSEPRRSLSLETFQPLTKSIKRFGVLKIIFVGVLLMFGCVAVALNGNDVMHFLVALFALGVGWNFMFIGRTTLLTETYRPEERNRVQGANDFLVVLTMATSSFASGALVTPRAGSFSTSARCRSS